MTVPLLGNKFQFVGCPAGCLVTILTELLLTTTVLLNRRLCSRSKHRNAVCFGRRLGTEHIVAGACNSYSFWKIETRKVQIRLICMFSLTRLSIFLLDGSAIVYIM